MSRVQCAKGWDPYGPFRFRKKAFSTRWVPNLWVFGWFFCRPRRQVHRILYDSSAPDSSSTPTVHPTVAPKHPHRTWPRLRGRAPGDGVGRRCGGTGALVGSPRVEERLSGLQVHSRYTRIQVCLSGLDAKKWYTSASERLSHGNGKPPSCRAIFSTSM